MKKALGYLLLSAGLFLASSHLFLALWTWAAHGQPDIIARGSILLGLLSPYFSVAIAVLTVAIAMVIAIRHGENPARLGLIAAAAVSLTYTALYLDRTATVWRALGTIRLAVGSLGYLGLEASLLLAGAHLSLANPHRRSDLDPAV